MWDSVMSECFVIILVTFYLLIPFFLKKSNGENKNPNLKQSVIFFCLFNVMLLGWFNTVLRTVNKITSTVFVFLNLNNLCLNY